MTTPSHQDIRVTLAIAEGLQAAFEALGMLAEELPRAKRKRFQDKLDRLRAAKVGAVDYARGFGRP